MNIADFKAKIESYGGPARGSLFMVDIMGVGSDLLPDEDVRLFCRSSTIPGIGVSTFENRPMGFGLAHHLPSGFTAEPLSCIFMLDSGHRVLNYFHSWMEKIVNFSTSKGNLSMVDGMHPYEIGFKDEYTATMRIRFFSPVAPDNVYEVVLSGVFPTSIGSVNLAYDENDTVSTLPVGFSYSGITFSGQTEGVMTDRFSRSTGLVERISRLGGTEVQRVSQYPSSSFPNTIQDIINRYTRVKNEVDKLKRIL